MTDPERAKEVMYAARIAVEKGLREVCPSLDDYQVADALELLSGLLLATAANLNAHKPKWSDNDSAH